MFGKIIRVIDNLIYVENTSHRAETGLIGYHVSFLDNNKNIVGEIQNIDEKEIEIGLIGEIKDDKFIAGVLKKPNVNSS